MVETIFGRMAQEAVEHGREIRHPLILLAERQESLLRIDVHDQRTKRPAKAIRRAGHYAFSLLKPDGSIPAANTWR